MIRKLFTISLFLFAGFYSFLIYQMADVMKIQDGIRESRIERIYE